MLRRLAGEDPEVNEEWNCDKGRWAFEYTRQPDRLTTPLIRDRETGELHPASWAEALSYAARGLAECVARNGAAVLAGGRHTVEDAYAYAKFAREALGTRDMDFRARPNSAEEAAFLRSHVIGRSPAGSAAGVTYEDLERAGTVLLVAFEPEEESPIVFLRLRKGARKSRTESGLGRPVHHPERREDVRLAGEVPSRAGAGRARCDQPSRGRDRARRRAAGERPRRFLGRRASRGAHRGPGGLGAAARR